MLHTEEMAGSSGSSVKIPPSLLQLSADLKAMFEKRILCDMILRVGNKDIQCHRAILSARSSWFSFKIPQLGTYNNTTIVMNESDQIIDALLVYIYTGNLRLIESLKIPLLDLHASADKYGLNRFKKLLTKMIKSVERSSMTKTIKFMWHIDINDCKTAECSCPLLQGFSLNGTDKWHLKLRSICIAQVKYVFGVYLQRQTIDSTCKIHIVSLETHILDTLGQKRRTFVNDHFFKHDGESKMSDYISLCRLQENAEIILPNGILTLAGQLTVSELDTRSSSMIFQIKGSYEKGIANELHALSYEMFKMMKAGRFCDMSIHIKGSPLFKVHACLLYARSSIPIGALSTLMDWGIFDNIVARSFINFMYTGQTRFLDDYMRIIYDAVWRLQLTEAKIIYSKILANNLTVDNVFGILTDADVFEDNELIIAALFFVTRHTNDLVEHGTWSQFAGNHPSWAKEIMQMARLKRTASLMKYTES